jgi:hypothetical protein
MIEPVYVPYEQYRAAKMRCGLNSRIYGIWRACDISVLLAYIGMLGRKKVALLASFSIHMYVLYE